MEGRHVSMFAFSCHFDKTQIQPPQEGKEFLVLQSIPEGRELRQVLRARSGSTEEAC